uniref:Cytochrome b n=1 Tax=Linevichella vortex TaxID=686705 RepID=A0A1L5BWC4_9CRUS|nr:cytochrome b [Linevichella vortex]
MTKSILTLNPLMKVFTSTLIKLPAPTNISTMWNFGSILSICLILQLVTGLLLASTYSANMSSSFQLVSQMMETSDKGWILRYAHANGASLFFASMYLHIGRGIFYSSFLYKHVWAVGVTILLLSMATAFMGYVLPISQMSYWGASVITSLFSEVPYMGPSLVQFIWGGSSVSGPTITRFFTFHFLFPFVILALVATHVTFLHQTGSSNPLGLASNSMKITFNFFFSLKDLAGALIAVMLFLILIFYWPLTLGDDENFTLANPAVTPQHIQPEWYFLFAYAILRSVPNKLGGVIALVMSVMILYLLPLTFMASMKSSSFYPCNNLLFWALVFTVALLTWIGMRPVEEPYVLTGQVLTLMYFTYFLVAPLMSKLWDVSNL